MAQKGSRHPPCRGIGTRHGEHALVAGWTGGIVALGNGIGSMHFTGTCPSAYRLG
jgi:hypothetical protein